MVGAANGGVIISRHASVFRRGSRSLCCLLRRGLGAQPGPGDRPKRWPEAGSSPTPTATRSAPSRFGWSRCAGGMRAEFDKACAAKFPFVREIAAWTLAENDFLRLIDAKGGSVLEFNEVESGVFEAPRPGEGILFIQNAGAGGPPSAPPRNHRRLDDRARRRQAGLRVDAVEHRGGRGFRGPGPAAVRRVRHAVRADDLAD